MPGEKTGGDVVALHGLGFWIPEDTMLRLHGDPVQQTGGAGAMPDLGCRHGRFARVNAIEPIAMLIVGCVDLPLRRAYHRIENFGIAGAKWKDRLCRSAEGCSRRGPGVAADKDPAFVADPLDAVFKIAGDGHDHAVGVAAVGFKGAVHVPEALGGELSLAPDFDGAGELGVHAPVRGVDMMRAPAGDHACAELLHAQPSGAVESFLGHDAIDGVGHFGR